MFSCSKISSTHFTLWWPCSQTKVLYRGRVNKTMIAWVSYHNVYHPAYISASSRPEVTMCGRWRAINIQELTPSTSVARWLQLMNVSSSGTVTVCTQKSASSERAFSASVDDGCRNVRTIVDSPSVRLQWRRVVVAGGPLRYPRPPDGLVKRYCRAPWCLKAWVAVHL